jgi:signal transduction histidine kinase
LTRLEHEWVTAELDQASSDSDQTASDSDQTASDSDQTSAERDEAQSEADQLISDRDQAIADRDRAAESAISRVEGAYELSRAERLAGRRARIATSMERDVSAADRLRQASLRDASAHARDRSAEDRDRTAAERDEAAEGLEHSLGLSSVSAGEARERMSQARARAAADRVRAGADRRQAALDRDRAAEERALASAELRSAEAHTQATLATVVAGVAHNFNNLLAIVLLSAEQLVPAVGLPERAELEQIIIAADRGAEITAQLLAFAGLGNDGPTPVRPSSAIRELEPTLARLMDSDIALEIALDTDDGQVFMDAKDFDRIVVNLVLNARDAMPAGEKIRIASGPRSLTQAQAAELGREPGDYVDRSVSDAGIGISAEMQERMFDPFFTTKGGQSTGLGLATVRRVVERAGGWIDVRSTLGAGTTLLVTLPQMGGQAIA